MDLETFISETLISINKGVKKAQKDSSMGQTKIVPHGLYDSVKLHDADAASDLLKTDLFIQRIEFDVALTVSEETTLAAKGGGEVSASFIKVVSAKVGTDAEGKMSDSNSKVTRVKFSIPISLAAGDS